MEISTSKLDPNFVFTTSELESKKKLQLDKLFLFDNQDNEKFLSTFKPMVSNITLNKELYAYRGMRLRPNDFRKILNSNMENKRKYSFMVTFGVEPIQALYYALRPPKCDIDLEEPACSVIFQLNLPKIIGSDIRIEKDCNDQPFWDVWGDIPKMYFNKFYIFNIESLKFQEFFV